MWTGRFASGPLRSPAPIGRLRIRLSSCSVLAAVPRPQCGASPSSQGTRGPANPCRPCRRCVMPPTRPTFHRPSAQHPPWWLSERSSALSGGSTMHAGPPARRLNNSPIPTSDSSLVGAKVLASSAASIPIHWRSIRAASRQIVPEPQNGSSTTSPSSLNDSMIFRYNFEGFRFGKPTILVPLGGGTGHQYSTRILSISLL